MTAEEPEIDYVIYTSIAFPSDNLTIRDLRRAHPDQFDVDDGPDFFDHVGENILADDTIGTMLYVERLLARGAYEEARGNRDYLLKKQAVEREGLIAELAEDYMRYGLASGPQHAQQLIRDFEAQAAAQAVKPGTGKGR